MKTGPKLVLDIYSQLDTKLTFEENISSVYKSSQRRN